MPAIPISPNVVDLCSDSDDESEANTPTPQGSQFNRDGESPPRSPLLPWGPGDFSVTTNEPISGRVHSGIDIDTLEEEIHLIPPGMMYCRGCKLSPYEFDEDGNEIPREVTNERRDKIIRAKLKAQEEAKRAAADNNTNATNTVPLGSQNVTIHNEVPNPPGTSRTIQRRTTIASPTRVVDLSTPDDQSAASRTEPSSNNEDGLHVRPTPVPPQGMSFVQDSARAALRSLPTSKNKGKGRDREPIAAIDLSLLESDDDPNSRSDPEHHNSSLSGDEDLRRAIALSLQDDPTPDTVDGPAASSSSSNALTNRVSQTARQASIVSVTRTPTDNLAREAGETQSKGTSLNTESDIFLARSNVTFPGQQGGLPTIDNRTLSSNDSNVALPTPFGLTGLDRKQMEAERLARLKRKRQGEEDNGSGIGNKVACVEDVGSRSQATISPPPPRRFQEKTRGVPVHSQQLSTSATGPAFKNTSESARDRDPMRAAPVTARIEHPRSTSSYYPKGVVLKTRIAGYDTTNTIDFATLISPSSSLESCLLSSFIWDFDWLFPHFDTKRTKFQLVMHAKASGQREALMADFLGIPNVRLCFPPMDGNVNCMHSKLMLFSYNDDAEDEGASSGWKGPRCRIVVPTANLVGFDWGVGGFMENTVWLIDLPVKTRPKLATPTGTTSGQGQQTQFEKSLIGFLKAQTVPEDVIERLEQFDFSETAQLGFVHTIGGMHVGESWRSTGLCGLSQVITDLGLASRGPIEMDCVTSSLGSLTDEFMRSMYLAAQGDDGLAEYERRTLSSRTGSGGRLRVQGRDDWKERMRVYYPSDETVRRSKGGPSKAGTICFSSKWWQNGKFPKANLRDCVSVREGLLMHNKLMFVRYAAPVEPRRGGNMGWAYVGSANLSESAWGRLVQDRATKQPKLNCRNWECGVILPHVAETSSSGTGRLDTGDQPGLVLFDQLVPLPMRVPSERLEGRKPWTMFD
ncbi:hypothetical protein A1O3_01083 [Capronia epimyces CBS 606.96]|uniref:PLD phosphodiesterase domain-containing protein n=1 Tax=Capronia epimyces CBS 606.96 TaxID=1182542 RepID=W9YTF4_9EURO|nr:uncharacterized protein A1O3_01083 [Capronia epimyces CBS 606.96]EXJ92531.1 hypothetical protein A1O3_01083 [Capronia epimyces CBS 606.96]